MRFVTDRKKIAKFYLKGWFTVDLLSIVPFDLMVQSQADNMANLVRVTRVGKLYKLVKLTRLIRVLKIVKEKSKFLKYIGNFLQLSLGFERLSFFIFTFLMMTHILTCLWVMIASFVNDQDYKDTWLEPYFEKEISYYMTSFYWATTTITTVGYGDISAHNDLEMVFCTLVQIIGVSGFAFASSSLTSIITNYDQTNAEYQQKVDILNKIYKKHKLPFKLYINLKKAIGFNNNKDFLETN